MRGEALDGDRSVAQVGGAGVAGGVVGVPDGCGLGGVDHGA